MLTTPIYQLSIQCVCFLIIRSVCVHQLIHQPWLGNSITHIWKRYIFFGGTIHQKRTSECAELSVTTTEIQQEYCLFLFFGGVPYIYITMQWPCCAACVYAFTSSSPETAARHCRSRDLHGRSADSSWHCLRKSCNKMQTIRCVCIYISCHIISYHIIAYHIIYIYMMHFSRPMKRMRLFCRSAKK